MLRIFANKATKSCPSTFSPLQFVRGLSTKLVEFSVKDRLLRLKWDDGHVGIFPIIWLRDVSPDEKTYSIGPAMKARNLVMSTFDVEQKPEKITLDSNSNQLLIHWPNEVISRLDSSWLRYRDPSCQISRSSRRNVYLFPNETWNSEQINARLKKFKFDDFINDDKTTHDFLEAVCLDGLAILTNGPKNSDAVRKIGDRIGLIHTTHFGQIFEVSTKPDASNMAYASASGLPFHTDFPSLSNPPQLQMLHVVQKAAVGGNSLFVDGFNVAEQLRVKEPKIFETLTKYSMEFIEEGFDIHEGVDGKERKFDFDMVARHRIIKLNDEGKVIKIQFGNAMRSWFYDCEPEKIQEIYRAMKVFTNYCYDEKNVLKLLLNDGDTVLWANTRLLHTRDSYTSVENAPRTLAGCYFAWDIVKSRVRVLRDRLNLPQNQPSV